MCVNGCQNSTFSSAKMVGQIFRSGPVIKKEGSPREPDEPMNQN